ncbi:PREDICTED: transcription cofactor vestigial-like protein 4 [Leptosomus discolor]|nr:PREDICTED: transcription cofactor vestigial-like protein 4 [Leptosomus discolor]
MRVWRFRAGRFDRSRQRRLSAMLDSCRVLPRFTTEFEQHQAFPEPAEQPDVPWQYWAPVNKTANGDYRKEHRERSRSPIERAAAPTMSLHANHMYASIPSLTVDQPLALTKNSMDATRTVGITPTLTSVERQQNRPSVITCASASARNCNLSHCPVAHSSCGSAVPAYRRPSSTTAACDPVVEEHFRRSLGKNYKEPEPVANSVSITGSVDDHFAKALGDTWLQLKAAKDGVSGSPESASRRGQSSPSSHMVNHNHSPSVVS